MARIPDQTEGDRRRHRSLQLPLFHLIHMRLDQVATGCFGWLISLDRPVLTQWYGVLASFWTLSVSDQKVEAFGYARETQSFVAYFYFLSILSFLRACQSLSTGISEGERRKGLAAATIYNRRIKSHTSKQNRTLSSQHAPSLTTLKSDPKIILIIIVNDDRPSTCVFAYIRRN